MNRDTWASTVWLMFAVIVAFIVAYGLFAMFLALQRR